MTIASTVTPNTDGAPTIRLDLSFEDADAAMTALARAASNDPNFTNSALLDSLYLAVSEAADRLSADMIGCEGLWPDAAPMPLTEPAVLGSDTGDMLAILIPGTPSYTDAITLAVQVAQEAGARVDAADPNLMAEVWQARWMVLNTCESASHDFHPELAPHGPHTTGATLVTRVDLIHE